jgi:serine-type D-Ala-D-Ala carboxypeptidase (penicillin-binding protein 5/6)
MLLGRDPTVDGMKTGYTDAAGYCLVASAVRDMPNGKRRLVSVVMGTDSRQARASESQKLLNWGWQAWDALRLFDAGKEVATVPVWKGTSATVRLGTPGAIFVTVPKGEGARLKSVLERTDPLVAPLTAGQRVGTLKITSSGDAPVAEVPVTVLDPVPLAGVFGRAWDAIRLWIK